VFNGHVARKDGMKTDHVNVVSDDKLQPESEPLLLLISI